MRLLARLARAAALTALALLASVPAALADEPQAQAQPEAAQPEQRGQATPRARGTPRAESFRDQRIRIRREAPIGFESWLRELTPADRRKVERRLFFMPEAHRERFFRDWSRLSPTERRALAERLAHGDARRRRELPPRLRTPEMRERLAAMTPEQRRDYVARVQDWREMKPAQRHRMRTRLERFGALSAEEQQKLVDERFKRRKPEERARILSELRAASQQMQQMREPRGAASPPVAPSAPLPSAPLPSAPPESSAPTPE